MFKLFFILLLSFFSCTKNFTFSNNSKVRKISRDIISDMCLAELSIDSSLDVNVLSNKLTPLFDKYPPSVLENNESISSIILSDGRMFTAFDKSKLIEAVFKCILSDEEIFKREITNFDSNKENVLHVVIENYGIDNFWTVVDFENFGTNYNLNEGEIDLRKEILSKTLFFCNENNDSILSFVLKEVNKTKKEEEEQKLIKLLSCKEVRSKFMNNMVLTKYEDNMLSFTAKIGYRKIFDAMIGKIKLNTIHLINLVSISSDDPYYINKALINSDFPMEQNIFHELLLASSLYRNTKIVEELLAFGFGYYHILPERSKLKQAKDIFFTGLDLFLSGVPKLGDMAAIEFAKIPSVESKVISISITVSSIAWKAIFYPVKKLWLDNKISKINAEKVIKERLSESLEDVMKIQENLNWIKRLDKTTLFIKDISLLSEEDMDKRNNTIGKQIENKFEFIKNIKKTLNSESKKNLKDKIEEFMNHLGWVNDKQVSIYSFLVEATDHLGKKRGTILGEKGYKFFDERDEKDFYENKLNKINSCLTSIITLIVAIFANEKSDLKEINKKVEQMQGKFDEIKKSVNNKEKQIFDFANSLVGIVENMEMVDDKIKEVHTLIGKCMALINLGKLEQPTA